MTQIERLRAQIAAMQSEISAAAAAERKKAVRAELERQSPNAPDVVRRLALAELGSTEDTASEVSSFLKSEPIAPLLSQQQVSQQPTGKRLTLREMLTDIQGGGGRMGFGR